MGVAVPRAQVGCLLYTRYLCSRTPTLGLKATLGHARATIGYLLNKAVGIRDPLKSTVTGPRLLINFYIWNKFHKTSGWSPLNKRWNIIFFLSRTKIFQRVCFVVVICVSLAKMNILEFGTIMNKFHLSLKSPLLNSHYTLQNSTKPKRRARKHKCMRLNAKVTLFCLIYSAKIRN